MKKSIKLRDKAKAKRVMAKRYRKRLLKELVFKTYYSRNRNKFPLIPRKVIVDDLYGFGKNPSLIYMRNI